MVPTNHDEEEDPILSLVFYTTQNRLWGLEGTIRGGLGPTSSIINHENATQIRLQVNLIEAFSQLSSFFPERP